MTGPTFSVVVPTYNQSQYLGACLDSIIAQTDQDWEAVVINDGSTDGTAKLADSYARRDPRIRVFHKTNGGVASALNEGLRQARGRWVNWLSSDDFFDPCKLEINRKAISEFPDCKFFFSYFRLLRESTREVCEHDLWGPLPDRELQIPTLFFRNYISGITICIERAAWQSIGHFDESLHYAQDYDMWLRLLANYPARFIPRWTVTNRNHALQGSEVFPQACYYDTAKAAILFLNRSSFESLFPLLDLSDPAQAIRALDCALAISADQSAFLYGLGWHPGLLWRAMEWIVETERRDASLGKRLRTKARWICRNNARRPGKGGAAFIWKTLRSALAIDGIRTTYRALDPVDIAADHYLELLSAGNPAARPLAEYLNQFHHLTLPNTRPTEREGNEIALVVDSKGRPEDLIDLVRPLVRALMELGWRSVIFVEGSSAFWLDGTTPVIAGPRHSIHPLAFQFRHRCALSSDLVNAQFPRDYLALPLSATENVETVANVIANLSTVFSGKSQRVFESPPDTIPLVFLTRALHGGGAERALYDIVHALDDRHFDITIIPLFESAHTPVFTKGLVVDSFGAASRIKSCTASGNQLDPAVAEPLIEPLAPKPGPVPLPASIVALASRLTPGQRHYIKSSRLFLPAVFVLRAIASAYRALRYGSRPNRITIRSPEVAQEDVPVSTTAPPPRRPFQTDDLQRYNRMADYVTDIVRPLGDRAILISVMEEATIVAWLTSLRTPISYLAWLHTVESLYLSQLFPDKDSRSTHDVLLHSAVARSEKCVFPSRGCSDDLMSLYGLPADHFQTIYNPIDLSSATKLKLETPEKPLKPDPALSLIVSLGRLSPEKGHDHLLKALSLLRRRRKDFLCLIIGEGESDQDIAAMIERYGLGSNVNLLGAVQNPFPYLARAKSLVLASKFESFSLVLVEAMASGAIPVSVDCPTGPREVLDQGRAGILIPPGDENALADAIEEVLWSGRNNERLLAHAAGWVKTFDIAAVSLQWERLVKDVFAKVPQSTLEARQIESCPERGRLSGHPSRASSLSTT